jgi:hypothetical protein
VYCIQTATAWPFAGPTRALAIGEKVCKFLN